MRIGLGIPSTSVCGCAPLLGFLRWSRIILEPPSPTSKYGVSVAGCPSTMNMSSGHGRRDVVEVYPRASTMFELFSREFLRLAMVNSLLRL